MHSHSINNAIKVGLAAFIPLTLLCMYLQFAWASYQSLGGIGAAIFAPLWITITSPLWLLLSDGEQRWGIFHLLLGVFLIAMAWAALGSTALSLAIHFIRKNRAKRFEREQVTDLD